MILTLERRIFMASTAERPGYCIGHLFAGGEKICDTLERPSASLDTRMNIDLIRDVKYSQVCCIPTGTYCVSMAVFSHKFGSRPFYLATCDGKLPRLMNVPGWSGVLIHCGNKVEDTHGCILVGRHFAPGILIDSRQAFRDVYALLRGALLCGESLNINIVEI